MGRFGTEPDEANGGMAAHSQDKPLSCFKLFQQGRLGINQLQHQVDLPVVDIAPISRPPNVVGQLVDNGHVRYCCYS